MEQAAKLQRSIESLESQLSQLQTALNVQASIDSVKQDTTQRLSEFDKQISNAKVELDRRFEKLIWTLKIGPFLFAILGFFGFRYTYNDIKATVSKQIETELRAGVIKEGSAFYENLMAGTSLSMSGRSQAAIYRLKQCFIKNHYYDTSVLIPLLTSMYRDDEWEDAPDVLKQLKSDHNAYPTIPDPTVYILIAGIEIQGSIEHPEWLEEGRKDLEIAQRLTLPSDSSNFAIIEENYWVYHLANNDFVKAQEYIDQIKKLDTTVYSWQVVARWKFFIEYFKSRPSSEPKVKAMWEQLRFMYREIGQ